MCVDSPIEGTTSGERSLNSGMVRLMDDAHHFMSLLSREERERIMTALDEGVDWQEIPE